MNFTHIQPFLLLQLPMLFHFLYQLLIPSEFSSSSVPPIFQITSIIFRSPIVHSPFDPKMYPYFLIRFKELFFTSSPDTLILYLPSSFFFRTFSQVSKSAFIQSLIVFKADVSFIHPSLSLFLRRQNGKSTR